MEQLTQRVDTQRNQLQQAAQAMKDSTMMQQLHQQEKLLSESALQVSACNNDKLEWAMVQKSLVRKIREQEEHASEQDYKLSAMHEDLAVGAEAQARLTEEMYTLQLKLADGEVKTDAADRRCTEALHSQRVVSIKSQETQLLMDGEIDREKAKLLRWFHKERAEWAQKEAELLDAMHLLEDEIAMRTRSNRKPNSPPSLCTSAETTTVISSNPTMPHQLKHAYAGLRVRNKASIDVWGEGSRRELHSSDHQRHRHPVRVFESCVVDL